jgi:hypothetical protein
LPLERRAEVVFLARPESPLVALNGRRESVNNNAPVVA